MATTTERSLLGDLVWMWRREVRSLLGYLADISSPVVVDDRDREILAAFGEFHLAESGLKDRVHALFLHLGVRPDAPAYPMSASTYNFMRPIALAEVFLRMARQDRADLLKLADAWADAVALDERTFRGIVTDYVATRDASIARIEKILGIGSGEAPAAKPAAASAPAAAATAAPERTGPAWHDEALSLEERMALVKGMGLFEQLFAAMAQTDCTACGYDCEGYARAIADGEEKDLTKCAPGELETRRMLEKLMGRK